MEQVFNADNMPSRMYPYDFQELTVKNFGVKQLGLLSKCLVQNDLRYMLEAMSQVIDKAITDLTIGDFYYLLAWQRTVSYPKSPVISEWHCQGYLYTIKGQSLPPMTLSTIQAMTKAWQQADENTRKSMLDPDTTEVEEVPCNAECSEPTVFSDFPVIQLGNVKPELDIRLDYPRVSLLPTLVEALADPETVLLVSAAQWIKQGQTLVEKLFVLQDEPDLTLFDIAAEANSKYTHGISEVFDKICPKCGTPTSLLLKIEPSLFFRI